ncbi:ketoacyl-ACP synthase III [Amycolatopsis anabasis]|uniref:ketoacyl-ACP synthase III n=1 Tax=Amycolatopsis anabasis TaxID=1840409 RepID=UPI00131BE764|nr:ketoacyl-ACP synthase III [Amycolatopsis anabasis]
MTGIWRGAGLRFAGFGHYYPEKLVPTPVAEATPGGNDVDQAVVGDVGVRSRHVAREDESILYMAEQAGLAALRRARVDAAELDLVVLSNWTDREYVPELGPQLGDRLGARRALAFDIGGACSGFVHGTQVAASLLTTTPGWHRALVVCSDQFARRVYPGGRAELVMGDAAGAAVLELGAPAPDAGLIDSVLFSAGDLANVCVTSKPQLWIKTEKRIVEVAIGTTVRAARALLERNGLAIDDIDRVVPHPGSKPILGAIAEELRIRDDQLVTNFFDRANTSSPTIPTTVSEYLDSGELRTGQLVLAPAAGAGWFFGGLLFRL